jgi:hypothetical protein
MVKGLKKWSTYFWLISAKYLGLLGPFHCKLQKGTANDTVAVLKQWQTKLKQI